MYCKILRGWITTFFNVQFVANTILNTLAIQTKTIHRKDGLAEDMVFEQVTVLNRGKSIYDFKNIIPEELQL